MHEDSVLQEVRTAREEYARAHDFDVYKIVADLEKLNRAGDWTVVRLAPRRPQVGSVKPVAPHREQNAGEAEVAASS